MADGAKINEDVDNSVLAEEEKMDIEENGSKNPPEATDNHQLEVKTVCRVFKDVAKRWNDIGLKAGLKSSYLSTLSSDFPDKSAEEYLDAVVTEWFREKTVTWEKIVQLLVQIGRREEAKQVAQEHGVVLEEGGGGGIPDYQTQKEEIHIALQQRLKKGDTWYLVDVRWMKQWKKYVGYDKWDQSLAGEQSASPGPVDNVNLFRTDSGSADAQTRALKEHLMEELDYFLLPESAWDKLTLWYQISDGSCPVPRKVVEHGLYMKHCKVEVYLLEFKLSIHPNCEKTITKQFSRANTVAELEGELRDLFSAEKEAECRIWHRYMTHSYELLSNSNQTLQDAGLYNGQTIVLEKKNEDGTWPRSSQMTSSSQHPTRSSDSSFTGLSSSVRTSYTSGASWSSSYSPKPTSPGLCGLNNLGNTCFMNSALQCLSNTRPLSEYFLGTPAGYKPYVKHINKANPLGMGGAIAEAYGALLEEMWSGKCSSVAPRQFKTQVGRYAPQFVGYAQHDSQELLAFLLDGLHEDLNLVKEKPYVDMTVKTEGREDKEVAEETWLKYMHRNQSVIVRLFQGQLKSTLVCPDCNKTSKTFDPFMFLSLPLPVKKTRNLSVFVVHINPDSPIIKYKLKVPKRGCIHDLKKELHKVSGVATSQMIVIDVYNSRFHRVYSDRDSLSSILDRDDIYVYELSLCQEGENMVHVPVYHREAMIRYNNTSYQSSYHHLFGVPMVVAVPRECPYRTLYQAILDKGRRYIKSWTKVKEEALSANGEGPSDEQQNSGADPSSHSQEKEPDKLDVEDRDAANDVNEDQNRENQSLGSSVDQEEGEKGEGEEVDKMEDGEEKSDSGEPGLFQLVVVNSYGSQEVKKLHSSQTHRLTGQTYIACDWSTEAKEKCYIQESAEEVTKDKSCNAVDIGPKNIQLMDCLELFAQREKLSEDDAWYCPHCKEFVQATKKFDLWRLPDILVIHLKRFSYDRYWRDKLDVLIEFPVEGLNLTKFVHSREDPLPFYDLFAVSNHFGGMGGGHYTAYAKNKMNQKWYNYDDSHVSETSEDRLVSAAAYVLFYHRRTEGRPVNILDRSLSQSFAEEKRILSRKYRTAGDDTVPEEDMETEQEGAAVNSTNNAEEVFDDTRNSDLEQPD